MNAVKAKLRQKIKFAIISDLILSLYFAGFFHTALRTLSVGTAFNPIAHFKVAYQYGVPVFWFLFCLISIGGAFTYLLWKEYKDQEGMDKMGRLFRQTQKRQSYGDSHFEEPEEYKNLASIQSAERAYGTILGQMGDDGKKLLNTRMDNTRSNRNIAVVGASGSGKTFTFAKPFCYQTVKRRESIVITDPDGGLYRDMAGYFMDHGYIVRRLDLTNLQKSDGWDCMKSITPWNADLDAQMFAQAVIANTVDDLTSIYATGPMSLLKALILRVYLGHDFPEEQKNIGTVYGLLQNPLGEEFLDRMFDANQLSDEEMPCLGPYLSFKQGSPNLRGNLITNLSVQLQLFQNQLVCKVLSTDDIDLLLPGKQPCAYFCLFPDSHDTFRFIVSLFFSMFFTNLISYADQKCGGALPIPVNFLLDEFPSIGRLPDWDRKMATIRKRNLNAVMIFQNITQIQNLYDTTWITILSNCATMLSLGINDGDTADMWSKRIGDTTIQAQTEQHPAQEALFAFAHSHSEGEGRRALLSYDELHKIDQDDCIILFQGHNPIWARKYPHILHPESKKLRTILPEDIPDITDEAARKARRDEERQRVSEYLALHPLSEVDRKYQGLCESDLEKQMRNSIWSKARDRMISVAERLDGTEHPEETEENECASDYQVAELCLEEEFILPEESDHESPIEKHIAARFASDTASVPAEPPVISDELPQEAQQFGSGTMPIPIAGSSKIGNVDRTNELPVTKANSPATGRKSEPKISTGRYPDIRQLGTSRQKSGRQFRFNTDTTQQPAAVQAPLPPGKKAPTEHGI